MSVIIINPNSTSTMTDAMVQVAQRAVPELSFEGWTSHLGPASIQGEADGLRAAPPFLELVRQANEASADCIIIGCFDDTALEEAAALSDCPVIGIGQAAYHYAALNSWRFSVVTTLAVSVPILEGNIERSGLSRLLMSVRASDVAVLELEDELIEAEGKILAEARRAEHEDGIDALILGCAGMVQVTQTIRKTLAIHVLDPVEIAATCAAWIVRD